MEVVGLKDVRLHFTGLGYDLVLDAAGRIDSVKGADKLVVQCLRAVVNADVLSRAVNVPSDYFRAEIFRSALMGLRAALVAKTNEEVGAVVKGYLVYVSEDGVNFKGINRVPLKDELEYKVEPEKELYYRVEKVLQDDSVVGYYSVYARASEDPRRCRMFLTPDWLLLERSSSVLFKFRYMRYWLGDELLRGVEDLRVEVDANDPRRILIAGRLRSMGRALPVLSRELERI